MTTSTATLGLNISSKSDNLWLPESAVNLLSDFLVFITIVPTIFLVCFITLIFCREIKLRENSKYIFFMNLVVSDSMFLISVNVGSILFFFGFHFNIAGCHFYTNFYRGLFNNGIACITLMGIERFVAICQPLRYHSVFNQQSALRCLAVIWFISFIFPIVEMIVIFSNDDSEFHNMVLACEELKNSNFFNEYFILQYIRNAIFVLFFSISCVTLVSTYILVLKVAKQAASTESDASKATRTIRLHGIQLILYLSAFGIQPFKTLVELFVMDSDLKYMIETFLYFLMFVSPRFFSPFIYGLRDKEIRRYLRRNLCRGQSLMKVTPQVSISHRQV